MMIKSWFGFLVILGLKFWTNNFPLCNNVKVNSNRNKNFQVKCDRFTYSPSSFISLMNSKLLLKVKMILQKDSLVVSRNLGILGLYWGIPFEIPSLF